MTESLRNRLTRWQFNLHPAYRGTGGRITYIADDWHEVHIQIPLNWRTRNLVGTMFGGSLYGAVDPVYMIMLMRLLGPDYIVWDQAAQIEFRKPARTSVSARFLLEPGELARIQEELKGKPSLTRTYQVELKDRAGVLCSVIEKKIYVRRKLRAPQPAAED